MRTDWLTLIVLAPVLAGCGIDKRTSAFQCETDGDCDSDRRCEEGFCTVGPRDLADAARAAGDGSLTPVIDAPTPDAFLCPVTCTGGCLEDSTCAIDCSVDGSCSDPIVCPANVPCQVSCTGMGSCAGSVSCAAGAECDVDCSGADSCGAGVSCADACSCEVLCGGAGSCATPATCPAAPANKCRTGNGCNATGHPRCDEC